jgi:hypothetical protein
VLVFEIPVLSEAKQYNFYNPTPIPIFSQSEVHIPKLNAQYIAISKSGSKYYAITAEEFRQCKTQPNKCLIRRRARPLQRQIIMHNYFLHNGQPSMPSRKSKTSRRISTFLSTGSSSQ